MINILNILRNRKETSKRLGDERSGEGEGEGEGGGGREGNVSNGKLVNSNVILLFTEDTIISKYSNLSKKRASFLKIENLHEEILMLRSILLNIYGIVSNF